MKETIRRTLRTFFQAAIGYISANIVMTFSGIGNDAEQLKGGLTLLIAASVAAGLAAVMNLPEKEE